jgi:multiple sugar transport system permease protein
MTTLPATRVPGPDVRAARRAKLVRRVVFEVLFFGVLAIFLAGFMFVFYWMVVTSLKLPRDVTIYPPALVFEPTLRNYANVLEKTPFFLQLRNSLIVAGGAVLLAMLVGLPASYAASRYRLRTLALTILMMRMMPTIVFMLPLFVVYQRIGLIDTHLGLILSHLILTVPLIVWVMIGFFEDVPPEIEDQARVDGCNRFGVFWRIALPLALPGIVVTTILSFLTSWDNFVFVLILGGARTTTLPLAVFNFMGFEMLDFGGVAAVASMLSMPIVILTIIVQRWLVGGLTMGAIK